MILVWQEIPRSQYITSVIINIELLDTKRLLLLRELVLSRLNLATWKLDSRLVWTEPNAPHIDDVSVSTATVSTWSDRGRDWCWGYGQKENPWMLRVQNLWSTDSLKKKKTEYGSTKTSTRATKILHESDRLSSDHVSLASLARCVREMPNSWSQ